MRCSPARVTDFSERTDDPAAFANLLGNQRRCGSLLGTPKAFIEGATYQHLFKRNGIHHVLDVALRDGTGPIGILGIFREENAPGFLRGDVATISSVYDHLVHALARRPFAAADCFDEADSAMLVVDQRGVIQWALQVDEPGSRTRAAALSARRSWSEACSLLHAETSTPSGLVRERSATSEAAATRCRR